MRLFIAVELEETVKNAVHSVANGLRLFGTGRFSKKDAYHITLAFLGEQAHADAAEKAVEETYFSAIELSLGDLGNFGDTLYVGIKEDGGLSALHKRLSAALESNGFSIEERTFIPHVTLVRRYSADVEPVIFVPDAHWEARRLVLMETVGEGEYRVLYAKT